jgi:hypothetical protein
VINDPERICHENCSNQVAETIPPGAALVEFAVISPVVLALLVGSIEVGRGINVKNRCAEAARSGARVFSLRKQKTETDVRAMVDQIMRESKLTNYTVTLDPDPSTDVAQLAPVTVTVSIAASDASWYPSPWFLTDDSTISSSCSMPADLGEASSDDNSANVPPEIGELIDDDPVKESSGTTSKDVKDREKDVRDLIKEARKLREKADKLKKQAEKEAEKARRKRDKKAYHKALKKLREAEALERKAIEAERIARDALKKLTAATSHRKSPSHRKSSPNRKSP